MADPCAAQQRALEIAEFRLNRLLMSPVDLKDNQITEAVTAVTKALEALGKCMEQHSLPDLVPDPIDKVNQVLQEAIAVASDDTDAAVVVGRAVAAIAGLSLGRSTAAAVESEVVASAVLRVSPRADPSSD